MKLKWQAPNTGFARFGCYIRRFYTELVLWNLKECVKRKVMQALSQNPNCSGLAAKDAMEAVWDVCYNDTQPFDRAP